MALLLRNAVMAKKLLLILGANSDLPSYKFSQFDRGCIEAVKSYGSKQAADYMILAGVSVKAAIRLIQIGSRG